MVFGVHLKISHVVVLFTIVNFTLTSYGFNLETRLPMIKVGRNGSYFGFAVAAHQIRNEAGNISEGMVLVGAPLDKNLQPNTNHSGALWRCPLTNDIHDCAQVVTDGRRDSVTQNYHGNIDNDNLFPPGKEEIKDGQWLGATVKSQGPGEKVLVCAHRYAAYVSKDLISVRGLCYILKQDLEFHKTNEPCKTLSTEKGHEEYGVCQSGTSGLIFEDDNLITGSPGSRSWKGAIAVMSVSDDIFNSDKGSFFGPKDSWDKIKKDSYLGMSVTAGYFIGDNITVVAAGAPRSNEIGQVVLFVKTTPKGNVYSSTWEEYLIISGEQIASHFGYQVASADVNGDRLSDLIVAAPFYFNLEREEGGAVYIYMNDPVRHLNGTVPVKLTGKLESRFGFAIASLRDLNKDGYEDIAIGAPYEGKGVVYIYLGSANGLILKPSQIIKSENINYPYSISTFGYSLDGGMDLDLNGYPDLAIGAYEQDMILLLRARPIIGFTTFVRPEYNLTNIDSTARNCLINNTNYISCFSFETCCVIDSLVKTDKNRNLKIKYQLEAETFERKTSRIWFDDFYTKNHIITKDLVITNSSSEFCQRHTAYLKENTLDIQSPIKIRMSYKLIHKEPELDLNKRSHLQHLDDFPILNQQQADKIFEATFLKDCGRNDVCESRLVTSVNLMLEADGQTFDENRRSQYVLILGEHKNLLMNIDVNNVGESAYQTQLFVHFPKEISFNKISSEPIKGRNQYICHSTIETYIICMLGNPLKQNERVNLQLEFDLENVNGSEPLLEFAVVVNTTSNDLNMNNQNPFKLSMRVAEKPMLLISGHSIPEEVRDMQNIELKGESIIKYKEEIGNSVFHHYTIENKGTWDFENLMVEIEWPIEVANDKVHGKWLLYIDDPPVVQGGSGRCEISKSDVNPLGLKDGRPAELIKNYTSPSDLPSFDGKSSADGKSLYTEKVDSVSSAKYNRVKRDTEYVVRSERYTTKDGKIMNIVKMNCVLNSAKCLKFSCYLDLIESKQSTDIIIKSRLWDATLIEDYADVDLIQIASRAKMHIPHSPRFILSDIKTTEFRVETNARVIIPGKEKAAPISLLLIFIAIIIGLLLFILLTLLLWKVGFFKRRRPDPTLSGNLEKHKLDDN